MKNEIRRKADELRDKFKEQAVLNDRQAVKCALIELEDILNMDVFWFEKSATGFGGKVKPEETYEFWEEVKKVLESSEVQ